MTSASFAAAIATALAAAAIDARTGIIPNLLTRTAAGAVFAIALIAGTLADAAHGAAAVAGSLLVLFMATRGRGLGFGDVKLGVVIGGGCGAVAGLVAVGSAFVLGAAYATPLLVTGRARRNDAIPFAPFLAAGTIVAAAVRWIA
jgi:prepilin signal peptidase PulO-like enzyme (type II secretory pathway)